MDKDKIKATINKVANRNSTRPEILREMLNAFFEDMKAQLESDEVPTILIRNFGRFKPTVGRLDRRISNFTDLLETLSEEDKKVLQKKIDNLNSIKDRLKKEIHNRKDGKQRSNRDAKGQPEE